MPQRSLDVFQNSSKVHMKGEAFDTPGPPDLYLKRDETHTPDGQLVLSGLNLRHDLYPDVFLRAEIAFTHHPKGLPGRLLPRVSCCPWASR